MKCVGYFCLILIETQIEIRFLHIHLKLTNLTQIIQLIPIMKNIERIVINWVTIVMNNSKEMLLVHLQIIRINH